MAEYVKSAQEEFLEAHPTLAAAIEEFKTNPTLHAGNTFARDVVRKFELYGRLSDKQIEALLASLSRDRERAAEATEPKGTAPLGRVTVSGEVLTLKQKESYGGGLRWKLMLKLPNNSKVWVTRPMGCNPVKGDTITITSTFKHSPGDPSFAFGSRTVLGGAAPPKVDVLGETFLREPIEPKASGPSILEQLLADL